MVGLDVLHQKFKYNIHEVDRIIINDGMELCGLTLSSIYFFKCTGLPVQSQKQSTPDLLVTGTTLAQTGLIQAKPVQTQQKLLMDPTKFTLDVPNLGHGTRTPLSPQRFESHKNITPQGPLVLPAIQPQNQGMFLWMFCVVGF